MRLIVLSGAVAADAGQDGRRLEALALEALAELFVQVLKLTEAAGLVQLGHVALDGTKIKANASKHKAMSYTRMKQREGGKK